MGRALAPSRLRVTPPRHRPPAVCDASISHPRPTMYPRRMTAPPHTRRPPTPHKTPASRPTPALLPHLPPGASAVRTVPVAWPPLPSSVFCRPPEPANRIQHEHPPALAAPHFSTANANPLVGASRQPHILHRVGCQKKTGARLAARDSATGDSATESCIGGVTVAHHSHQRDRRQVQNSEAPGGTMPAWMGGGRRRRTTGPREDESTAIRPGETTCSASKESSRERQELLL